LKHLTRDAADREQACDFTLEVFAVVSVCCLPMPSGLAAAGRVSRYAYESRDLQSYRFNARATRFRRKPKRRGPRTRRGEGVLFRLQFARLGHATKYTTEDWVHINPLGGCTRGRDAVLKELDEVRSTFLKGVSDNIEKMSVVFPTPDVAAVTVLSQMSTFTTPDGVKHENERHIRTFVLVRRNEQWRILQHQNTAVAAPKA